MKLTVDEPKSLRDPVVRQDRLAAIQEEHVSPLTSLVGTIRQARGLAQEVPYFDPADGGIMAKCLFLLEAPGPQAVRSGFVSRNNPDETANNFFLLNQEAGLPRNLTVTWNVVPWYIGDGTRIRPAAAADILAGKPYLAKLLTLLPRLQLVLLIGRKAQRAAPYIEEIAPGVRVSEMLHPGPRVINRDSRNRSRMLSTLKTAGRILQTKKLESADA